MKGLHSSVETLNKHEHFMSMILNKEAIVIVSGSPQPGLYSEFSCAFTFTFVSFKVVLQSHIAVN